MEVSPEDLKKVLKTAGVLTSAGGFIAAYLNDDSQRNLLAEQANKSTYLSMVKCCCGLGS